MRKGKRGQERLLQKKLNAAVKANDESMMAKLLKLLFPPPVQRTVKHYDKPRKVCLRRGCNRAHTHNNAFCCAEHHRDWNAENPFNGKGYA